MREAVVLILLGLLVAGCADPDPAPATVATGTSATPTAAAPPSASAPPPTAPPAPGATRFDIRGVVVDEALRPLAANVTLVERGLTVQTGAGGAFAFKDVVAGTYFLRANAPGHREQTLTVDAARARDPVRFVLEAVASEQVHNVTVQFRGRIECALEAAIITPSCDSAVTSQGGPALFEANQTATVGLEYGWRTVVADLVFDTASQPGIDGLRVTVRGTRDADDTGEYEQYGRFNGTASFTFRLEPGVQYPEGTQPVPGNLTGLEFAVYPQSHLWHAACDPSSGRCFLGVGAGTDVQFDLFVTAFYGEPAPAGWSLRT